MSWAMAAFLLVSDGLRFAFICYDHGTALQCSNRQDCSGQMSRGPVCPLCNSNSSSFDVYRLRFNPVLTFQEVI